MFDPTMLIILGVLLVFFIVMNVISRRRGKKQEEKYTDMIDSLEKGDKVYLISRLIAYVVKVEKLPTGERYVTVETGEEGRKSTLTFDSPAIHSVLQKANAPKANVQAEEAPVEQAEATEAEAKTVDVTEENK